MKMEKDVLKNTPDHQAVAEEKWLKEPLCLSNCPSTRQASAS